MNIRSKSSKPIPYPSIFIYLVNLLRTKKKMVIVDFSWKLEIKQQQQSFAHFWVGLLNGEASRPLLCYGPGGAFQPMRSASDSHRSLTHCAEPLVIGWGLKETASSANGNHCSRGLKPSLALLHKCKEYVMLGCNNAQFKHFTPESNVTDNQKNKYFTQRNRSQVRNTGAGIPNWVFGIERLERALWHSFRIQWNLNNVFQNSLTWGITLTSHH